MASSDVAPLPIGIILYGYRIDKVLGQGGFGVTYLGTKMDTQKVYVIKENIPGVSARRNPGELKFHWIDGAEDAEGTGGRKWSETNFIREATRLTQLKHRGIVTATEAFRSGETGTAYYTMPYVSPNSLSHMLRSNIECTKEWVLYLLAALLDSLKYVHSKDILHRDIKPENILISPDGEPVIIDFGSARGTDADHKTRIVSANYSPIEQMRGEGEGPWTDIYSLAASIYQVVTGDYVPQLACRGGKKDAYIPLASRSNLVARFGAPLLSSLDKALAFEPEDRYQSTTEWMNDLKAEPAFQFVTPILPVKHEESIHVAPTVLVGDNIALPAQKKGKGGLIAMSAGLAAVLLCLIGGALWWYLNRTGEVINDLPLTGPGPYTPPVKISETPAERALRIIARPDIKLYDAKTKQALDKDIPAFAVYYTYGEKDGYYEVAERPDSPSIGVMKKEDVRPWPYNLVIDFNSIGGVVKRDRSLFFNESAKAKAFVTDRTTAERHDLVTRSEAAAKGSNDSDLEARHGVVAIEPKQWGNAHKLLPVIDFVRDNKGSIAELAYNDVDGDIESSVLKICAMTEKPNQTTMPAPAVEKKEPLIDVVYVVDTTRSMGPYIDSVREFINDQAERLDVASKGRMRFGMVAYRDWKYAADGLPDTSFCGYNVKNYNESLGHMMNLTEFRNEVLNARDADGEYDLRETKVDSVDCAEDVFAGLHEAIVGMPWRDKVNPENGSVVRLVILIGDAPGRELGTQESDHLRLSSPYWQKRALGSLCGMNVAALKDLMKDNHIHLQSYFVLTPPPNGIKDKHWLNYLKIGTSQFRELSYADPGDKTGEVKCCTVVAGTKFNEADNKEDLLKKMKIEATSDFGNSFAANMNELATLAGGGVDANSTDPNASAAKTLFTGAYVEWFSKQPSSEDMKTDMEGWTQDTNDRRSETMEAKIVLSRAQVEQVVQNLQNVINGMKSQEEDGLDAALNDIVSQMYTLISDPNLKNSMGNDAKKLISALPYKSNLLVAVLNDAMSDASSKAELLKDLGSRVKYLAARLSNDASCIPDPKGDKKKDLFLIPVRMLP